MVAEASLAYSGARALLLLVEVSEDYAWTNQIFATVLLLGQYEVR
jgi:hypothetical protein